MSWVNDMATVKVFGYADKLAASHGDTIDFMVSVEGTDSYRAEIVKLLHGSGDPTGPGFRELPVECAVNGDYIGRPQSTIAGSYVLVSEVDVLGFTGDFSLHAFVFPTVPTRGPQVILARWNDRSELGVALVVDEMGCSALWIGAGQGQVARISSGVPLVACAWCSVGATYSAASGTIAVYQWPAGTHLNNRLGPVVGVGREVIRRARVGVAPVTPGSAFLIAACWRDDDSVGRCFNGKIERPRVYSSVLNETDFRALTIGDSVGTADLVGDWDFAQGISAQGVPSPIVVDLSRNHLNGECKNMPTRAVTGHLWTGAEENFTRAPEEYGAIHFHDDDLEDAGWDKDFSLTVPEGLASGIYAARLAAGDCVEHVPFVVRPLRGVSRAKVLLVLPTATYLAYANERSAFDANLGQPIIAHTPIIDSRNLDINEHVEFGLSMYDVHSDGSGVCYSSALRPILSMRPGHQDWTSALWNFSEDLCLIDWLETKEYSYDVVTDEDLDRDGSDFLKRYRVVLTGTHPEYSSARMLDAVEDYLGCGGRLMYLGGNGFYWCITYHPEKRHVIEVRRGEGGSRAWQAAPGELYHSTTGERGGIWRNRGRSPQKLVGVGFATEGFDVSSPYIRMPDSFLPEVGFIFRGLEPSEPIGGFGLVGGGASGQEMDRYDLSLGTPPHALLLATSAGQHSDAYTHVVEEILETYPGLGGTQDYQVRADMVYFTTRLGGGVFSTGSIAWCASLAYNNYENNVSRITGNVLERFLLDESL